MGGGHSTERKVNAVLDAMSSTIVKDQGKCLAQAANSVWIEAAGANNAIIRNVTINQSASATASCDFNDSVQIGALQTSLQDMLNGIITSANKESADNVNITDSISRSVTKDNVTSCVQNAVNNFRIQVGTVSGTLSVTDLNINQVATSSIKECLAGGNTKVGDVPLQKYLTNNLGPYNVLDSDGNPVVCAATESYAIKTKASLLIAGVILLLFVIVSIVVMTYHSSSPN